MAISTALMMSPGQANTSAWKMVFLKVWTSKIKADSKMRVGRKVRSIRRGLMLEMVVYSCRKERVEELEARPIRRPTTIRMTVYGRIVFFKICLTSAKKKQKKWY